MTEPISTSYHPPPRYLCRKWLVLRLLEKMEARGPFLEVGTGAGDLLEALDKRGFYGKSIDFSGEAIALAQERLRKFQGPVIEIQCQDFRKIKNEKFRLLFAFEVLEHIEDDRSALSQFASLLQDRGVLLLSVPAHTRLWGPSDVWAGHFRRYERQELIQKLEQAGFQVELVWSYGVPLVNWVRPLREFVHAKETDHTLSPSKRTQHSGVHPVVPSLGRLISNDFFLYPFYRLQQLFLKTDLGDGYLVKAVKNHHD